MSINIANIDNEWTRNDEKQLIDALTTGASIEEFSVRSGKSLRSVQHRLKKIIYTNIMKGKTAYTISIAFGMHEDAVRDMFYEYRKFNESKKTMQSPNLPTQPIQLASGGGNVYGQHVQNMNVPQQMHMPLTMPIQNTDGMMVQYGGMHNEKSLLKKRMDKRVNKLDDENKILRIIIENKELHRKLDKLISDGVVDPGVKLLLKELKHTKL